MLLSSLMYLGLALLRICDFWVYSQLGTSRVMLNDVLVYFLVFLCSSTSLYAGICSLKVRYYHGRLLFNERLMLLPLLRLERMESKHFNSH